MAGSTAEQVCKGMVVRTADGARLGRVADVWWDAMPAFAAGPAGVPRACLEVRCGLLGRAVRYVPAEAVAEAGDRGVRLSVDRAGAERAGWRRRPAWLGAGRGGRGITIPYGYEPPGKPPVG